MKSIPDGRVAATVRYRATKPARAAKGPLASPACARDRSRCRAGPPRPMIGATKATGCVKAGFPSPDPTMSSTAMNAAAPTLRPQKMTSSAHGHTRARSGTLLRVVVPLIRVDDEDRPEERVGHHAHEVRVIERVQETDRDEREVSLRRDELLHEDRLKDDREDRGTGPRSRCGVRRSAPSTVRRAQPVRYGMRRSRSPRG